MCSPISRPILMPISCVNMEIVGNDESYSFMTLVKSRDQNYQFLGILFQMVKTGEESRKNHAIILRNGLHLIKGTVREQYRS